MGNNPATCCETPITDTILDQPVLTTENQLRRFLRQNPIINETLIENNKIQLNQDEDLRTLIETGQTLIEDEGSYIGETANGNENLNYSDYKSQKVKPGKDLPNEKQNDVMPSIAQKQGKGIMMYSDGDFYYGFWNQNKRWGRGLLIYSNGEFYEGEWFEDEPNGSGVYQGKNPLRKYQGSWKNGMQEGKGTQYYSDGSFFTGKFENGLKSGQGKMVYKDGTFYEGQFSRDKIEGEGVFSGKKHRYEGEWADGKMNGTGRSEWFNEKGEVTSSYIGEYENGVKNGFGEYRWGKNRTYKGRWENGEIKNTGVLFDIDSPNKVSRGSNF